jgi:hypothetical protein
MADPNSPSDDKDTPDTAAERSLRGGALGGAEKKRAADHTEYQERRNPDTELHLDEEEDTLYDDGLDIEEEDPEPLAGTRGSSSGIKP